MFYIRKRSIKYLETARGVSFTAHLLEKGSDVHLGMVEQAGRGAATTFLGATPHVDRMVDKVADHFNVSVDELMEIYMDIAEGVVPQAPAARDLQTKVANYNPK